MRHSLIQFIIHGLEMIMSPTNVLLFSDDIDHGMVDDGGLRAKRTGKVTGAQLQRRHIQAINGEPIGTFHFNIYICIICCACAGLFSKSGSLNVFVYKCRSDPQ